MPGDESLNVKIINDPIEIDQIPVHTDGLILTNAVSNAGITEHFVFSEIFKLESCRYFSLSAIIFVPSHVKDAFVFKHFYLFLSRLIT